jgi:hypothetical protein
MLRLPQRRICRHWESEFGIVCERPSGWRDIDLAAHFDSVEEEGRVGAFIADVLLSSSRSDKKLLIEVAVTHRCDPSKIASGLRIVEVSMAREDQLGSLEERLNCAEPWITLHNLKEQKPVEVSCTKACDAQVTAFHVFRSGKTMMQSDRPHRVAGVARRSSTVYSHVVEEASHGFVTAYLAADDGYRREAARAHIAGAPIRCCSLCRYAGFRTWEKPVFCKFRREEVGVNDAADCEAYRPDPRSWQS